MLVALPPYPPSARFASRLESQRLAACRPRQHTEREGGLGVRHMLAIAFLLLSVVQVSPSLRNDQLFPDSFRHTLEHFFFPGFTLQCEVQAFFSWDLRMDFGLYCKRNLQLVGLAAGGGGIPDVGVRRKGPLVEVGVQMHGFM